MKTTQKILSVIAILILVSCGGKDEKKEKETIKIGGSNPEKEIVVTPNSDPPKAPMADMANKGIGPVKSLVLGENIDQGMVQKGEALFKSKCMACHKPNQKFIGPAPVGIFERRAPEWIMNMILNPEEMIQKDPIAKQLLIEHNGSPMANQGLTEEEAREILAYYRVL